MVIPYNTGMENWNIIGTPIYTEWFDELTEEAQDAIFARIQLLEEQGPNLGRPTVELIKGSQLNNLKELRASHKRAKYRILFIFDPKRNAVLLVGGDKTGQWDKWYRKAIPEAEDTYEEYLRTTRLD